MIGRGLLIVTVLSNCVLSLPVTSSQLENEDVKVMKCIVEALADVLSRPHPVPVSQECLVILRTDDRLVTILRHQNFLKELQEIAVHGGQERAQVQRDAAAPAAMKQTPLAADDASDRSMLEALGSTSERSILSQKRKAENRDGGGEEKGESLKDGEDSLEDSADIMEETPMKRDEEEESPGSHVSKSVDEWSEGKDGKREDEEEEEEEEKRAHSEESSEENLSKKEKGAASEEKRDAPRHKSKEQTLGEEDEEEEEEEEEEDKRSSFISDKHEEEEEGDVKRGSKESTKQWNKRGKGLRLKKKADGKEAREPGSHQEVAHHSKEAAEDEEGKKKRDAQQSPEEKELQMIAGRTPEERKGLEEEGSASRKSEEPEIESLAAIESELENVAQKLHELRRG